MEDTVIVIATTQQDQYGNLIVTDKAGNKIKIGEKRSQLHGLFQQGKAIRLHWEVYKNKQYVADATLVEGELPEPTTPYVTETKAAPQEIGMWWKEMGEMLRTAPPAGIDPTTPAGKLMRSAYYTQMMSVLGIEIKDKEGG